MKFILAAAVLLNHFAATMACVHVLGTYCSGKTADTASRGTLVMWVYDQQQPMCYHEWHNVDGLAGTIFPIDCQGRASAWIRKADGNTDWEMAYLPNGAEHDYRFNVHAVEVLQDTPWCSRKVSLRRYLYDCEDWEEPDK